MICLHCGCRKLLKNGHSRTGEQRYLCVRCNRTRQEAHVRKNPLDDFNVAAGVWFHLRQGLSIRKAAEKAEISKSRLFAAVKTYRASLPGESHYATTTSAMMHLMKSVSISGQDITMEMDPC